MSANSQNEGSLSDNPEYHPAAGVQEPIDNDDWLTVDQIGDVEEYFPRIRQRLADPNNNTPFIVKCPMCMETLFNSERPNEPRDDDVGTILTPCGHIACKPCLDTHLEHQTDAKVPRVCPVCRHNFECVTCGSLVVMAPVRLWEPQVTWLNAVRTQTVPEGASQRPECAICLEHQAFRRKIGCRELGSPAKGGEDRHRIFARLHKLLFSAMVEAARYGDTFGMDTRRRRDLADIIVEDVLSSLEDTELTLAAERHRRDQVQARNEWMGFGNPRRR